MKEKELRIALVCFGGVSLAVYMHGITKEILKLVRASSALHAIADRNARATTSFFDAIESTDPEYDTEQVYFELLREIGRTTELRVIVDIIAGASAGGINGALLARALSHNLTMGALRDLWLDYADVNELLAPEARASAWSKWILKPVVWAMSAAAGWNTLHDREARAKLSLFVRSRWFKAPLSGLRMAELMYDSMVAMGAAKHRLASLLPSGQKLDLFITVTDYYGYEQLIQIHQPPLIYEREHRHVLRFQYERRPNGEVKSDFDLPSVPALAFAARATSSFPGAFPPAQIVEMDRLLAGRSVPWPARGDFIQASFEPYLRLKIDPAAAYFIDGSVLNNRPFRQAIAAIRGRPAYRQVDRRVVYIDPDPALPGAHARRPAPGFFAVLKSALSDLPSIEPVTEELQWVEDFNGRVDRLREIIDDARPRITRLVGDIAVTGPGQRLLPGQIKSWRKQANVQAASEAGFAYEGYVRLKLTSARAFLSGMLAGLHGSPPRSPEARFIAEVVDAWAGATGRTYDNEGERSAHLDGTDGAPHAPKWIEFLLCFDIDYRKRRLHFMIEGQNRLYQMFDEQRFEGFDRSIVDRLKRKFYNCLDVLNRSEDVHAADSSLRDLVRALFPATLASDVAGDMQRHARQFYGRHREAFDGLVARLGAAVNLESSTDDVELLLADAEPGQWHPQARHELIVNYLGFPFWDVLTFPVMRWRDVGEFSRILIDRISPQDARSFAGLAAAVHLRGTGFGHFAAFLSRAYRENDYLLGRLHALDRLVDIVCDSAGFDAQLHKDSIVALKKKGFSRILDAEQRHLPHTAEKIAALRQFLEQLAPDRGV